MNRSLFVPPVLALVGMAAVVAVGGAVPAPPGASQQPVSVQQLVTGGAQVCPSSLESPEALAEVSAVALADNGLDDADDVGGASLDLFALDDSDALGVALASTTQRGETITTPAETSLLVSASGALAPGLLSESTVTAAGQRTSGLASQPCLQPARDWWFAAGSGAVGRRATLLLANPSSSSAVVNVQVWAESGPLSTAGTSDLGIPAFGTRTIALDAVAVGSQSVAVHVAAAVGKVSAAVALREIDGADPVGLSFATPSQPPALRSYVPGLPAFGERRLRLLNPGDEDAIVRLRALAGQGPFTPLGLEAIDVPAGRVVDIDLAAAGEEAFALEVDSTAPVVAAAELRQTPRTGLGDLAVMGAAPTIDSVAGSRVSSADGRSSRMVLSALPASVQPDGEGLTPTDAATPTPDPTATTTPTATPTTAPTVTPSPTSSPAATAEPTPTGSPSPTASPTATGEPGPIDLAALTTQVVVRLIGLDGRVLKAEVATLGLGTTDTFPLDLPADVDEAWVTVEPVEPGLVLAARETTTTVDVPDPLDPDVEREAFWLDLVALRGTLVTVEVPPVLPDITAGLARETQ